MKSWFRAEPASNKVPGPSGSCERSHGYSMILSSSQRPKERGNREGSKGCSSARLICRNLYAPYRAPPTLCPVSGKRAARMEVTTVVLPSQVLNIGFFRSEETPPLHPVES